jgi:hypothetical protein
MSNSRESRRTPRAKLSQTVRIRPCDIHYPEEVCNTSNISRGGIYFVSSTKHYYVNMAVYIAVNYRSGDPLNREELAEVVRVDKLDDGKFGIAIRILMRR